MCVCVCVCVCVCGEGWGALVNVRKTAHCFNVVECIRLIGFAYYYKGDKFRDIPFLNFSDTKLLLKTDLF